MASPVVEAKTIDQLIDEKSAEYNVSASLMRKVIHCESTGSSTIQSLHRDPTGPNGREDSWGLAQIHLPDHPTVTQEQAVDKEFAVTFLAKNLSEGRGWWWTCYKIVTQ